MMARRARVAFTAVFAGLSTEAAAGMASDHHLNESPPFILVAKDADLPLSRGDLFGESLETGKAPHPAPQPEEARSTSKDSLFGIAPGDGTAEQVFPTSKESLFDEAAVTPTAKAEKGLPLRGFVQTRLAYAYENPEHWSDVLGRVELGTQGRLGNDVKWKASVRGEYNAVYDLTNFYTASVRNDQQATFRFGETYLDFSAGGLDWRVGRQQIVWGEMVGLFFADVVSAKDMREFILPDFQVLRVPQWAARAEYFKGDFHAEAIWIPFPSYDEIGKPFELGKAGAGSDFYPYPVSPAGIPLVMGEKKPGYGLDYTNYGIRLSQISQGWDVSGFWYSSMDSQPTFIRDAINKQVFYPRHGRIWQAGATLGKDLGPFVLKGEAVYTDGRRYNVTNLVDSDGLVEQNTLDWVVGLDINPGADTRLNTQFFQRIYFDHDPFIIPDQLENGFSLLLNHKLKKDLEVEALLVRSLNRSDWMFRSKIGWVFRPNWKLMSGVDVFGGPTTGIFGQFNNKDRVYTELRYDF